MYVFTHGLQTIGRIHALTELRLPAGGLPQVGSKGVGQTVGDVPDQFVFLVAHHAHGIVHLDFMEGVGGEDGIPVFGVRLAQD